MPLKLSSLEIEVANIGKMSPILDEETKTVSFVVEVLAKAESSDEFLAHPENVQKQMVVAIWHNALCSAASSLIEAIKDLKEQSMALKGNVH